MAAPHAIINSTASLRASTLRGAIADLDLRELSGMRRLGKRSDDFIKAGHPKLGQFRAAYSTVNYTPLAGHEPSEYAAPGARWRSTCSAISGQWAKQTEEPEPIVSFEEESLDLQAVIGSSNGNVRSSIVARDSVTVPRPLSVADLSNPPTHGLSVRVAYQGVPGAYSEGAALIAYPNCEAVPCEQFEAAFQAVELWLVDRAVLPIENSLGGSIHRNYDLLLRHRLHIVGEVQVAVNHCLLALPGVRKEELELVLSHQWALSQCEGTLTKLGVIRQEIDDTAGAAQNQNLVLRNLTSTHLSPINVELKSQFIVQHNLRNAGAVASARAAEIYGMTILLEGIQDDTDNVTRFLMLAREPIIPRTDRPFKTSIVFTSEEGPGVLFKALAVFSLRDINLTKIESRPQRKKPLRVVDDNNNGVAQYFEYLFYIDFEASMADPRAQNALGNLQEFATFLRVLGSYPMDRTSLDCPSPI